MVELVSKIILGGGLFAILITEIIRVVRGIRIRKRWEKEIAWELFMNEFVINKIIGDFVGLKKDPIGYLNNHRFKTYAMDSILNSGIFVNLNFKLIQFIMVYRQRFRNVQYELDVFFKLKDDEKIKKENLEHLDHGERASRLLLQDFRKSKFVQKLKKKYHRAYYKETIEMFEEKQGKKLNKKEKKELLALGPQIWEKYMDN